MGAICIDGMNLALAKGSGIATYGRNLLANARAIGLQTQVLDGPHAPVDAAIDRSPMTRLDRYGRTVASRWGRRARPVPSPNRASDIHWSADDLFHYARRAYRRHGTETAVTFKGSKDAPPPSAMHWTSILPMRARGVPNIHTFHDLIPLRLPGSTADDPARYLTLCQSIADRADHIATVSETTRQDVIRLLGVQPDRVTTTYQTIDLAETATSRPDAEVAAEIERTFALGWKSYFLFFGAIEPKKNIGRLIEAYMASDVDTPLVIVGGRSWLADAELDLLNRIRADDPSRSRRIRQYDYLPSNQLAGLIRGARATLFPSLDEGFGLPVLESMALGTAVLTSTAGALPEVAGEAAVMVDPYDVAALSHAIRMLDGDSGLRDELVDKGRLQADRFSPKAYQQRLRQLYGKVGIL